MQRGRLNLPELMLAPAIVCSLPLCFCAPLPLCVFLFLLAFVLSVLLPEAKIMCHLQKLICHYRILSASALFCRSGILSRELLRKTDPCSEHEM